MAPERRVIVLHMTVPRHRTPWQWVLDWILPPGACSWNAWHPLTDSPVILMQGAIERTRRILENL